MTKMRKILLVDDETLVLKSLTKLLLKEGYAVIACQSGEEAAKAVEAGGFDLVVCDVRMPKLNGVDTVKCIREILLKNKNHPTPEIFITGFADQAVSKQAEQLQVADYLYKPFDVRDFLACVKKHLKE